ncbi:MAG: serine/threonine-protein kinase, partial [Calditrichaceae bacterium]
MFLIMELVDGKSLNDFLHENRLTINEKIKLFLQICEAVKYAHNHLIVHRDLKPENIYITGTGRVKLLDFGIAKVFESDKSGLRFKTITQNEKAPFTPEYAAPEQINGEEISTATDVYALGVILYELLTGRRPYTFKTDHITDIQEVISNSIPSRPSTTILRSMSKKSEYYQLKQISRKIKGDLDNICLQALKKEPRQRYENVEQLRDDINCHLAGLPVKASGDFLVYRTRKFVQRHRLAVSFITMFFIIISSIIVLYTSMLKKQTRE